MEEPSTALVFGASGHGRVVADAWSSQGKLVVGFVDDDETKWGSTFAGHPVVGGLHEAVKRGEAIALGVGSNKARQAIFKRLEEAGLHVATVIHANAVVSPSALIGRGAVIFATAVLNPAAAVGCGAIINTGAIVEHDCEVGDFAHVSPRAVMGGAATLGSGAQLGIGATQLPLTAVGDWTVVGGGATVVHSVGSGIVVVGTPARELKVAHGQPQIRREP